ncbi:peptidoglycan-binding domain-containing protein [Rhodoflexus caldus]|uniref:peptidoglycan-binding domain-containing protein n=1 Tax=Rhodoflexus caldus TaxID=2891236 RepID=UPI002029CED3|nr:peptidoglycan-binding protein [Rhodoflexus caldus]
MKKDNKKTLVLIAIIVLLILAGYTALASKKQTHPNESPFNPSPTPSPYPFPSGGGGSSSGGGISSGGGGNTNWTASGCQNNFSSRTEYVKALQTYLNTDARFYGSQKLAVDGIYGAKTDAASRRAMDVLKIDAGQLACKVAFHAGRITLPLPY